MKKLTAIAGAVLTGSVFLAGCQKPNFSVEDIRTCYDVSQKEGISVEVYALNEIKGIFGRVSARKEEFVGAVNIPRERKSSLDLCFDIKAYNPGGIELGNIKFPDKDAFNFSSEFSSDTYLIKMSVKGVDNNDYVSVGTKNKAGWNKDSLFLNNSQNFPN